MGTRQVEAPIRVFVTRRLVTLTLLCALLAAFVLYPLRPGLSNPAANDPPPPPARTPAPVASLPVVTVDEARFPCQSEVEGAREPGTEAEYVVLEPSIYAEYVVGCVRDSAGNPIERAYTRQRALQGRNAFQRVRTSTGPGGRYGEHNIEHVGWWEITMHGPGREPVTKRVLAIQDRTAVLDFVLPPALPTPVPTVDPHGLEGVEWRLVAMHGRRVGDPRSAPSSATLKFYGNQAGGIAGCNRYGAQVAALDDRTLRLTEIGGGWMGCLGEGGDPWQAEAVAFERAYHRALLDVASYWVSGGRLEMYDATGESVLIFLSR